MQANIQNPAAKFKTAAVQELAEKVSAKLRARLGENLSHLPHNLVRSDPPSYARSGRAGLLIERRVKRREGRALESIGNGIVGAEETHDLARERFVSRRTLRHEALALIGIDRERFAEQRCYLRPAVR